jgi:hypothetical protein
MDHITFVIASLNNGYDDNPADPVKNFHLSRTLATISNLKNNFNANIVFVDWCSSIQNRFFNYLPHGIKYVHVNPSVIDELHKNNESTLKFYEWIAKDIGSCFVDTEWILFTNGDNLFTEQNVNYLSNYNLSDKYWYSATRLNIDNSIYTDNFKDLFGKLQIDANIKVLHSCNFCHGDFLLCNKSKYVQSGGFPYIHEHAFGDTILANRLAQSGVHQKSLDISFYHINHRACGSSFVYSKEPIDKNYFQQFILANSNYTTT